MAKIILQVDASINNAKKSIGELKQNVDSLAKSFNNVKANKDLTEQIKALTQWNKSLADAVKKVEKATKDEAKAELELERYRSQTIIRSKNQLAQGEEKIARERIKNQQETEKLRIQEQKLQQEEIKTAKAQNQLAEATKKTTEETDKQEEKAKGLIETLMQFSITSKLIHSGVNMIRNAVKDMNETLADTEKRIIAIQRVLPEGSVSDRDLTNRLYDLAIEYGQSFANVSDIATEFARTGISYADTIEATRAALLALNVAELDTAQATEGMIAIMAQFGLSADKMNDVVDKLNKTADRFPVTTQKLMAALQRMGSSASIAGLSLDETIGIATTLSKATGRSGANIGTAANALIQYSTKEKALNTYASLSPEIAAIVEQYKIGAANVLDIWQALSKEINNLTFEQSEKLDVLAEYFDTGEGAGLKGELEAELGDIFNDISGVFSTANTFRKNYFVALLQNMETVEEAAQVARDSQGYSIKENEKEMQTYERRVQALEEHWHKLANDEQGWLAFRKGLVEIGDVTLSILEWTGGLRTTTAALGSAMLSLFAPKVISQAKEFLSTLKGVNGSMSATLGWIGLIVTALSMLYGAVEKYKQTQHEANLESIQAFENQKKNRDELEALYKEYTTLNPEADKFRDVEDKIVGLLNDKNGILANLKKGTEEYTAAVKALSEAERENYFINLNNAANAAENELLNFDLLGGTNMQRYGFGGSMGATEAAGALAYNYNTAQKRIGLYLARKEIVDEYEKQYLDLIKQGNIDAATSLLQEDKYKTSSALVNDLEPYVNKFFSITAEKYLSSYISSNGNLKNSDDVSSAFEYILQQFANTGMPGIKEFSDSIFELVNSYVAKAESSNGGLGSISDKYSNIVKSLNGLLSTNQEVNEEIEKQNKLLEAQEKLGNAIAKARADYIKNQLQAYLDGLKAENDISGKRESIDDARLKVEEARLKVEEKRKNVMQAEYELAKAQELLNRAREERNVRVYNELTGSFELQANKKNVESAQERVRQATEKVEEAVLDVDNSIKDVENAEKNVEKAINSLQDYLKNKAIDEIKTAIENGNATESEIDGIFNKWFGNGGGTWGDAVKKVISDASGKSYFEIYSNETVMAAKQAVETAKQALDTVRADQFYSSLADLYGRGGTVTDKELNALIAEYKNKGLSQASINTALSLIDSILNPATPDTKRYEIVHGRPIDDGGRAPVYDNGGILSGIGGIKATSEPELIIDPELTKRILSPTSNGAFERFASELGVLYGNPARDRPRPVYTNNWNTASSSDNRSYNINGVPIPRDAAQKYTIAELFDNMVLV